MATHQLTAQQVELQNGRIYYLEGGVSSNLVPIVFLPGWSVSVETYLESLTALSQRYYIIAPDLPGFSQSMSSKFLQDYQDYARCIIAFINALNLEKVHLIGHSLGGGIALTIAALMPSITSSLVLVDSTGIPMGSLLEVLLRRSIEIPAQLGAVKIEALSTMFQSLVSNWLFRTQNVIQTANLCLQEDLRPLLSDIKSPSLVVWGEHDQFTPLPMGQELARGIIGSRLRILEGEYHEMIMFRPEKFAPIIFDFIDEVEKRR